MVLCLDPNFATRSVQNQRPRRSLSSESSSSSSSNSSQEGHSSRRVTNEPINRPICSMPTHDNRHLHGYFCPASSFPTCYLYNCQVHGCTCWRWMNSSTVITLLLGLGLASLAANALMIQFKTPEEIKHGCEQFSKKTSHLLKLHPISNEITRQLQILHYAGRGFCEWKESKKCKGLPNLASKELGSSIISTFDTKPYSTHKLCNSSFYTNGESCVCNTCSGPENMLKHDIVPGRNFNFIGQGRALIQMGGPAIISGFTLSHPHADIIPTGSFSAAPKVFKVWGHYSDENVAKQFLFGRFRYEKDCTAAQAFPIQDYLDKAIDLIEVKFETNHGNPNYTAVYRFEVHGDIRDQTI